MSEVESEKAHNVIGKIESLIAFNETTPHVGSNREKQKKIEGYKACILLIEKEFEITRRSGKKEEKKEKEESLCEGVLIPHIKVYDFSYDIVRMARAWICQNCGTEGEDPASIVGTQMGVINRKKYKRLRKEKAKSE